MLSHLFTCIEFHFVDITVLARIILLYFFHIGRHYFPVLISRSFLLLKDNLAHFAYNWLYELHSICLQSFTTVACASDQCVSLL